MNLAAASFASLRVCSRATSSRALARSSVPRAHSRLSALGSRHYSEQAASQETPPPKAEDAKPDVAELEKRLKAKEDEVTDLTGRLRYLQADFLNLQRNAAREKEQTRDYAISKFAGDLLETVDVLSIALKSVPAQALKPSSSSSNSDVPPTPEPPLPKNHETYLHELHEGVEMTQRQLLQTLFKYHVKPFDPVGDKFDPNHHEALYQAPVPGKEPGTVIDCQKIGYKIKDRVLRAAQVGVAQDTS
ncbi:GrpE protein-like protein, mitochondrial [Psilocybe cubensis]|uniref:GrpE protein homolog, mitochondrial n=2 Tax=Psilocybe cubensis TaxID=181762 RepID=A0A8H7Y577_PSICU|nr:GrpE protein-like protein, mitochondrial [Psilocybe cubensis]KAH9484260.1 GrpE protein-like protein, mitochondrial [Psilocybe cubensis]